MDKTTPNSQEFSESMHLKWAQTQARAERWKEEEQLILEEMWHVISFLWFKSPWWWSQVRCRGNISAAIISGLQAYAKKQAIISEHLVARFARMWLPFVRSQGISPKWAEFYATEVVAEEVEVNEASDTDSDSEVD
ncbi:hypothetical protein BKA93DRAFT_744428 [Sparassis latifolia]